MYLIKEVSKRLVLIDAERQLFAHLEVYYKLLNKHPMACTRELRQGVKLFGVESGRSIKLGKPSLLFPGKVIPKLNRPKNNTSVYVRRSKCFMEM